MKPNDSSDPLTSPLTPLQGCSLCFFFSLNVSTTIELMAVEFGTDIHVSLGMNSINFPFNAITRSIYLFVQYCKIPVKIMIILVSQYVVNSDN